MTDTGPGLRGAQSGLTVAALNWVFTAASLVTATLAYWNAAPPPVLMSWTGLGVLQLLGWAAVSLRLLPSIPSREDDPAFWRRAGRVVALGNNIVVVSGIWLLSPYGSAELRTIAMLFCATYIAIAIIATRYFGWLHYVSTATAIGSLIAVMVRNQTAYSAYLAPFIVMFGVGILWLGHILQRSRTALEAAWRDAEAARLEALAERDARLHFLASASHDFGQPLQAARLYFEQMQMGPEADRAAACGKLERALDVMEDMVAQVTHHLRLDAGAVMAAHAPIRLATVIARVIEPNEPLARMKGVKLRTLPTGLAVEGDAVLIERVLGNLVGNAIRHAHASRILVGAKRHDGRVRLWVIDDGRGVAPVDRATLFEPYRQGSDHGSEVRGGYGLGLSAVRMMAAALKGSAGHDPRWRNGSAFFLELPACRRQPAGVAAESARGSASLGVLPDLR